MYWGLWSPHCIRWFWDSSPVECFFQLKVCRYSYYRSSWCSYLPNKDLGRGKRYPSQHFACVCTRETAGRTLEATAAATITNARAHRTHDHAPSSPFFKAATVHCWDLCDLCHQLGHQMWGYILLLPVALADGFYRASTTSPGMRVWPADSHLKSSSHC